MSSIRKAVHTEKGIFDSVPLLPDMPIPKCPIYVTQEQLVQDKTSHSWLGPSPAKNSSPGEAAKDPKSSHSWLGPALLNHQKKANEKEEQTNLFDDDMKNKLFPHAEDKYERKE